MTKKVLYLDCETTGLDPLVNEIIQFAAIAEVDGGVVGSLNLKIMPNNFEAIDPTALETHGIKIEDMKFENGYVSQYEAVQQIISFLEKHVDRYDTKDKFFPAGHNAQFDLEFLQAMFVKNGFKYGTGAYQNWKIIDSRYISSLLIFKDILDVPDNKLETLCAHFGIELQAHDALSDVRATRELIDLLCSALV